ncbi:hypothetical protein GCM10010405_50500 [Streptomyces macrosporus]|uniref:Uncharacterized protein n=1 Tax=Streptomyces macrosporus TaxID=44032 RepID=A0ABP5XM99_9ACTN
MSYRQGKGAALREVSCRNRRKNGDKRTENSLGVSAAGIAGLLGNGLSGLAPVTAGTLSATERGHRRKPRLQLRHGARRTVPRGASSPRRNGPATIPAFHMPDVISGVILGFPTGRPMPAFGCTGG